MRVWQIVAPLLLLTGCRGLLDVEGAQKVADGFVAALAAGDTDTAYRWLALEWQRQLDPNKFVTVLQNGSLIGAKIDRPVWRGTRNNVAEFSVVVSTPEGAMTAELFLIRSKDGWGVARVHSPGYPWPPLSPLTEDLKRKLPPDIERLVAAEFERARQRLAVDDQTRALFSAAASLRPELAAAEVSSADHFRIDAIYATHPRLQLRLTLARDAGSWKSVYFRVRSFAP